MLLIIWLSSADAADEAAPPERCRACVAEIDFAEVENIVPSRCSMCHAAEPIWEGIAAPPKGVLLDTMGLIRQQAGPIHLQAVLSHAMPPGNITEIEPAERPRSAPGRCRRAGRVRAGAGLVSPASRQALRGQLLSFRDDPAEVGAAASYRHVQDGLVVIEDGRITAAGEAAGCCPTLAPGTPVEDWRDCLILPGLIDSHIHLPQTQVIASFGTQLLDWLQIHLRRGAALRRSGRTAADRALLSR